MPRDLRQFKGTPYQQPHLYPPPSAATWEEIGATAPLDVHVKGSGVGTRKNKTRQAKRNHK